MPAIALQPFNNNNFAAFLKSGIGARFDIDLRNATLVDVLDACEKYRQTKGNKASLSSLIYNVRQVEVTCDTTLMPVQVGDVFYAYFAQFLVARGCLPSTVNTYCAQLKAALTWASKHNCQVSSTYDEFQSARFMRTRVALTPDQVSHIYHFNIDALKCRADKKRTLCKVRDMFVLSCNLGQRYSDMVRVSPSCFNDTRNTFKICQQKTGNTATVDIDSMTIDKHVTKEILERYGWQAPYTGDTSNYDHYLHELLELIGGQFAERDVIDEAKIHGKIVKTVTPLHKKVSSHTARRTFVTYHVNRGVHEAKVRKCSGHTDSRSFVKYIIFDD